MENRDENVKHVKGPRDDGGSCCFLGDPPSEEAYCSYGGTDNVASGQVGLPTEPPHVPFTESEADDMAEVLWSIGATINDFNSIFHINSKRDGTVCLECLNRSLEQWKRVLTDAVMLTRPFTGRAPQTRHSFVQLGRIFRERYPEHYSDGRKFNFEIDDERCRTNGVRGGFVESNGPLK